MTMKRTRRFFILLLAWFSAAGPALRHGYLRVKDEVSLHYVTAGEGPLMVFVHGFPEF